MAFMAHLLTPEQLNRSEERRVGKEGRSRCSQEQAEDGIRDTSVTGVQTCALPICSWPHRSDVCPITVGEIAVDTLTDGPVACRPSTFVRCSQARGAAEDPRDGFHGASAYPRAAQQIGRASCRERG